MGVEMRDAATVPDAAAAAAAALEVFASPQTMVDIFPFFLTFNRFCAILD